MSKSGNVNQLFQNAQAEGILSDGALNALTVFDIGAEIQNALSTNVDDVKASEVILVSMMPDDSGSISFENNEQNVIDGHNLVIESLNASKQKDNLFAHCRYLNGKILYPYIELSKATKMDKRNYRADQGTPLYDQSVILLGTVLAQTKIYEDEGIACRTVTLIITDGADEHSRKHGPKDVAAIAHDMLMTENHIIAAMGIDDHGRTDFRKVFKDMGIRDEWILTPGNSQSEIRKAFNVFSQSAVRASQSAVNFSKSAMGGFGA